MADTSGAFDRISPKYRKKALVQQQAALKLISLLQIRSHDKVLDLGCGPGHLTNLLKKSTKGWVLGTDISEGMIKQAQQLYPHITFRALAAEALDFKEMFHVIFCNSTFQWFSQPDKVLQSMHAALKAPGKLGIACPATREFSPLFGRIKAEATERPGIKEVYEHWKDPWFFLANEGAYQDLFESQGFNTEHLEIAQEAKQHTVAEAYGIYLSGFANGLLGQALYDIELPADYPVKVNQAFQDALEYKAVNGKVTVDFNRLYYAGKKKG